MATVDHAHFEFFEAAGFQPGTTRKKKIYLPATAPGLYVQTAVSATAAPFAASNEDRQLRVTTESIKAKDPNPGSNDEPVVRVKVESIGPDAPLIWYLNLSIVDP
ncbi:hypothetical protein [Cellulomonas cellasea]|uniref:Uncharacterized protein n=1 Tax=Cellulomonas cellasea TaxID=43670 RepID=A0A4Y3L395_9CELL|nr:hypothetical protein [Cellulomonas cellasea]GEA89338.1 hypothetical protein CCE01nite_32870 [Cellulomonas cellasea]